MFHEWLLCNHSWLLLHVELDWDCSPEKKSQNYSHIRSAVNLLRYSIRSTAMGRMPPDFFSSGWQLTPNKNGIMVGRNQFTSSRIGWGRLPSGPPQLVLPERSGLLELHHFAKPLLRNVDVPLSVLLSELEVWKLFELVWYFGRICLIIFFLDARISCDLFSSHNN